MSHAGWYSLLSAFCSKRIDETVFHDRFFERWRTESRAGASIPSVIETFFYVVEAYCPDPSLRSPGSSFEADEAELRKAAEIALLRLDGDRPSGKLT